jgi:hypothetical protein
MTAPDQRLRRSLAVCGMPGHPDAPTDDRTLTINIDVLDLNRSDA